MCALSSLPKLNLKYFLLNRLPDDPVEQEAPPEGRRRLEAPLRRHLDLADGLGVADHLDEPLLGVGGHAAVDVHPGVEAGVVPQLFHHLDRVL